MKKILFVICIIICILTLISCNSPVNKTQESSISKQSSSISVDGLNVKSPLNESVVETGYKAKELADEIIKNIDIGQYNNIYIEYDTKTKSWIVLYTFEQPDVVTLDDGIIVQINDLTGELMAVTDTGTPLYS